MLNRRVVAEKKLIRLNEYDSGHFGRYSAKHDAQKEAPQSTYDNFALFT